MESDSDQTLPCLEPQERVSVAVIIAVFNGAATLERTLDSLAIQSARADEVIVMDGGSTDGTQEILARRNDVVSFWRSARDSGIYDAWNKALARATSDWVAFLGSDDYLYDFDVLMRLRAAVCLAPAGTPFIYGRIQEVDTAGRVIREHGKPWARCSERFQFQMTVPHPGMLHRRDLCMAAGGFDARYRIAGDYALLRPLLRRAAPLYVDFVVAAALEGGISTRPDRRVESVLEAGQVILAGGEARPLQWHLMLLKNYLRWAVWQVFGDAGVNITSAVARSLRGDK